MKGEEMEAPSTSVEWTVVVMDEETGLEVVRLTHDRDGLELVEILQPNGDDPPHRICLTHEHLRALVRAAASWLDMQS